MLYKGSAFRKFLIDRVAMGFQNDAIQAEFEATQGIPITEKEIEDILAGAEDEIKIREQQLMAEMSSTSFLSTLNRIKADLDMVRDQALADKDFKSYAQLTNSLIKSVEVLISVSEAFKKKFSETQTLQNKNNYYVFNILQKDGLIQILDEKKLRDLWGIRGELSGMDKEETKKTEVLI